MHNTYKLKTIKKYILMIAASVIILVSVCGCQRNNENASRNIDSTDGSSELLQNESDAEQSVSDLSKPTESSAPDEPSGHAESCGPEESSKPENIVLITDYEYRISYTDILDPGGLFPNGLVCFDRSTIDSVLEEKEKHNLFNIDREEYGYPSLRQRCAEYDDEFFKTKALLIIVVNGDDDEPPEIRCIYKQFLENINKYETWVRFKRYYRKNNQGYTVLVELDADLVRDTTQGIAFQERVDMAPEYEYSFPGEG